MAPESLQSKTEKCILKICYFKGFCLIKFHLVVALFTANAAVNFSCHSPVLKSIWSIYILFFHLLFVNRPSPCGDPRFIKWTLFFFASIGLTYEQSAVKLVVLKSGTVLYKTHAHISLLNVTFVCSALLTYSINGEGMLSMGFQYLSCITHAQLSKPANRIECEIWLCCLI